MEDISRPGRIDHRHAIGRRVLKLLAVPCHHAIRAQGRRRQKTSVAAMHLPKRVFEVGLRHQPAREVAAHNQIVNLLQQLVHPRIHLIDIRDHAHARRACPSGRHRRRCRVVPIDVQRVRIDNPIALQLVRLKDKPLIPSAEHRPLAPAVDNDQRLRAGATCHRDQPRLDARAGKLPAMQCRRVIIAQLPHIPGAHSPGLTRNHGGRNLPSRQHIRRAVLHLGTGRGKALKRNQRVRGIQPHADQINLGQLRHIVTVNGGIASRPPPCHILARVKLRG